jgi:hypothetical protein
MPSPAHGTEWSLKPQVKDDAFTIEIDEQIPGDSVGTYVGAISGNVGQPMKSPLEKQLENNGAGNVVSLLNGIEGHEIVVEGYSNVGGSYIITWEAGQWKYIVTAGSGQSSDSTIDYARQIIGEIGEDGQALSGLPGIFYISGDSPQNLSTNIYWQVNGSIWYYLSWDNSSNETLQILRSMSSVSSENGQ